MAFDKLDKEKVPSLIEIERYVGSPLWVELCSYLETEYETAPICEYSGCGMQPGWNVKYRKGGRGLCTLYPCEGYFICLVVVGEREREEVELAFTNMSLYTRELYENTKFGMGQRWLMIHVTDERILEDVKTLIAIRRYAKKR